MATLSIRYISRKTGNFADVVFAGTEREWPQVRAIFSSIEETAFSDGFSMQLPWPSLLQLLPSLRSLTQKGLLVDPDGQARVKIKEYLANRKRRDQASVVLNCLEIEQKLLNLGWKRKLRDPQLRDAEKLMALPHGANFSVPGAGKTTVTFAVHSLAAGPEWNFLAVCPPSAFGAWIDVVSECLGDTAPDWLAQGFVTASGVRGAALRLMLKNHRRIVTNYEHLVNNRNDFAEFLHARATHFVVDESHRIKAGRNSNRGRAILDLSDVHGRKDILSGTPAPQSKLDFVSQFEFLWNDTKITNGITFGTDIQETIGNFYVRTTKADLKLPPATKSFVRVPMSTNQALLYAMVRDDLVRQRMSFDYNDKLSLERLRKSVFTLLILMTNPLVAIRRLEFEARLNSNSDMLELLKRAAAEGHSAKINRCVDEVEDLVASGKKALVWTAFRSNGQVLESRLSHLNPLPMNGSIPVGDKDTPNTREHNRLLFHGDDHNVMIANPAACSEGMSLHKACHDAIYLDRTFNAAHYLQSIDRIHRLGIKKGQKTNVTILQSTVSPEVPSIDLAVARRMHEKISAMNELLNDREIQDVVEFEYEASSESDDEEDAVTFADKADLYATLRLLGQSHLEFEDRVMD